MVDARELCTGVALIANKSGSRRERIEALFRLFDENGDGFITPEEMRSYLEAVYNTLMAIKPAVASRIKSIQLTPAVLAEATTAQCFEDCDTNRDGRLSLEEFLSWALTSGSFPESESPEYSSEDDDDDVEGGQYLSDSSDDFPTDPKVGKYDDLVVVGRSINKQPVTSAIQDVVEDTLPELQKVREVLQIEDVDIREVLQTFQELADERGQISYPAFATAFNKLLQRAGAVVCGAPGV